MSEQAVAKKSSAGKIIGIGCLVVVVLAVVGGILVYQGVKSVLNKAVEKYTDTEPMELAAVNLPAEDAAALEERVRKFGEALDQQAATEPLELTSDEINHLITQNKEFANMLRVKLEDDRLEGTISAPLDNLGEMFSGFKGRYFNGSGVFEVQLKNGRLQVFANSLTVKGEPLPDQFMTQVRSENFAKDAAKNPETAKMLNQLESISIDDGKLKIVPKTTASKPTPTTTSTNDAPKKPVPESAAAEAKQ